MNRIRNRSKLAASTVAALAGAAGAQTFNIEINAHADSTGMPVFFFRGASGEAGGWNNINATSNSYYLKNTDSEQTSVHLDVYGQGSIQSGATPGMTGALANVMADYHAMNIGLMQYTFSNLEYGRYAVYTYAGHPSDPSARTKVTVLGDSWSNSQVIGGAKNGTTIDPGELYSVHVIDLQLQNDLMIQVEPWTGTATCAAIQLRKLDDGEKLRVYVDDSATGYADGSRWHDALPDLQEALKTASLAGGSRSEVWVAQGSYKPTSGTDRSATFHVPSGLALYGGFFGTEETLEERIAPALAITNLSGSIGSSDQSDNSYTVVTMQNASSSTIVDGFTISRGSNTAIGIDSSGGGVRLTNSSPTFRNVKFISNHASVDGGGVFVKSGAPSFVSCLFYNNTLGLGAGAGLTVASGASATVVNSEFIRNTAGSHGGAAQLYGSAKMVNCVFDGNTAPGNGGAINVYATGGQREINLCTFAHNTAGAQGGAIHNDLSASTEVYNSIMYLNTDQQGPSSFKGAAGGVTISHSVAQNLPGAVAGVGNTSQDPMWVDPDGANNTPGDFDNRFELRRGSPAIDMGNTALVPLDSYDLDGDSSMFEQLPEDLKGNQRVQMTSYAAASDGSPRVDAGALEHQPTCAGDLNADLVVDFSDLNILLVNFGEPSQIYDCNGDGEVSFSDLNILLVQFGIDCQP